MLTENDENNSNNSNIVNDPKSDDEAVENIFKQLIKKEIKVTPPKPHRLPK